MYLFWVSHYWCCTPAIHGTSNLLVTLRQASLVPGIRWILRPRGWILHPWSLKIASYHGPYGPCSIKDMVISIAFVKLPQLQFHWYIDTCFSFHLTSRHSGPQTPWWWTFQACWGKLGKVDPSYTSTPHNTDHPCHNLIFVIIYREPTYSYMLPNTVCVYDCLCMYRSHREWNKRCLL